MKTCKKCTIEKEDEQFSVTKIPYRSSYCRHCCANMSRAYGILNREVIRAKKKIYQAGLSPDTRRKFNERKKRTLVSCKECRAEILKRNDSLKSWGGRCRSCATSLVASSPIQKAVARNNGLAFIEKYGPPVGPRMENRKRGSTHYRWRGGVTPHRIAIWNSAEYKTWRDSVMSRDGFKCIACGISRVALQADQIEPFALAEHLRFDVDNGRTLCVPCHRKYGAKVSPGTLKLLQPARFDFNN